MGNSQQPVIIKKVKKVSGGGHHGGAWKVAYADFVTAMMAFFLLMWLLNATTEDQRKGIADYFNPAIPLSPISGGGQDILHGSSVFTDETLAKDGTGGAKAKQGNTPSDEQRPEDKADEAPNNKTEKTPEGLAAEQNKNLEAFQQKLMEGVEGEEVEGLSRHIQMHVTPEGLVIELVDTDGSPLFERGSTGASPTMKLLLKVVADSLSFVSNEISIVGHTDGLAFANNRDYSNWELSTDRAHVARKLMIDAGLPVSQISEVAGKADTEPLVEDKYAPQNRRISVTILRS